MNTRHLETFVAVVEKGSVSQAAADLYTPPNALTPQVNALERDLGVPLLLRDWRGTTPTPAGRAFYERAKQVVGLVELARDEARSAAGLEKQVVRVASYRGIALVQLQHALEGFAREHPEVGFSFMDGDYRAFHDRLLAGDIDLFIHPWGSELDRAGVGFLKLGETRLACSMAFNHHLANKEVLHLEDLAGCDVIVGCGCTSHVLDDFKAQVQREDLPIRVHRLATEDEVWTHVLTQGYLLVSMDYSARYLVGCASIALEGPRSVDYGLIYRTPPAPAVRRFVDYVAAHGLE